MYRQLVPDRPGGHVQPGPSRPERRPGPGRGQEAALPRRGRRTAAGRPRSRRSRSGSPARPARWRAARGRYATIVAEALDRPSGAAGPARRPLADLRRLADPDQGRRRADRRRLAPVAGRARPDHRPARSGVSLWPAAIADEHRRPTAGAAPGLSPDRAGRPGDRLRRVAGRRVQPERPARAAAEGSTALAIEPAWKHDPENSGARRRTGPNSGDPPVHADRRRRPDLRPDGGRRRPPASWDGPARHRAPPAPSSRSTAAPRASCSGSRRRATWSCPTARRTGQPVGQFRGDAGRRRPERLRRRDRPPRADRDLRRLLRRRDRRRRVGPLPGGRRLGDRQLHGHGHGRSAPGSSADYGHRLLSLDGPSLYYQTNLGAVAALDAETGRDPLGRHLSPAGPGADGQGSDRDLNPAIVHDGLVIVAPERRLGDLRLRRRQRPAGLEDRPDPRRGQAEPPAGRGQGAAGRHRRPRAAVRRQDRQAAAHLARRGQGPARASAAACWPATRSTGRPGTRSRSSTRRPGLRAEPPIKLQEIVPDHRRQPRRRRRLPDRRPDRRPGRLLPEQPPDRALSRRDRPRPDQAATYYRLARAAEAIGRDDWRWSRIEQASSARAGRRDGRRRSRWPTRRATTSSAC